MPIRTVGAEPGLQFGRIPAGSSLTICQFGDYIAPLDSSFGVWCPANAATQGLDFLLIDWSDWPDITALSSQYIPSSIRDSYGIRRGGQLVTKRDGAGRLLYGMNVGDTGYRDYLFGPSGFWMTKLATLGPHARHGLPIDAAHPTLVTIDGWYSDYGAWGATPWDSGYAQTRAAWYADIDGFFQAANTQCPAIRLCPHIGSLEDFSLSTFQLIYGNCPAIMREPFTLGQFSNRAQFAAQLTNLYWFANVASQLLVNDPPTRIVLYGMWCNNGDFHTALAIYSMVRGPNTFFDLLTTNGPQQPINPSVWLSTSNWLGAGTSAPTPVVGSGGSALYMRTFAGGISYFNFTGHPQAVTLPAGFTDWNGTPVSTATIADGKGDVFLAPTSGALPGSGGGGGGPGGGGPPPPPPPPVATATNTCCITINPAPPSPPVTPGTPNLYLALIGSADVTGAALTLAAPMTDGAHVVGLDSTDFAFLGSPIMIYGAGLGGVPFWTTIAAISDSLHATLTDVVPTNVTGKEVDCYFPVIQDPTAVLFQYYVLIGTYDMHSSLSTRPTLNFDIRSYPVHDSGELYVPNVGMPVLLIIEGSGDVFGGSIDQVAAENTPGQIPVVSKCQCVSWDQVLAKRLLMLTGAFPTGTNRDTFPGDGTQAFFTLSLPPVGMVSVTVNGVPQTFGINTRSAYLSWNIDDPHVTIFGTPPAAGSILAITYQAAGVTIAPPSYLNQTADQIFFALIQTIALQEGLAAIAVPGPVVDQIQFTSQDTVDSALKSLLAYISDGTTNFWYWVDPRKVVHFEVQGVTQVAPWGIDVNDLSDANVLMQVSLTTTREKFANACWADIAHASGLQSRTQEWVGDGNTRTFQTQYPIASIVSCTKVIRNFVTNTLTNITQEALLTGQVPQNPGDAWYFNADQSSLTEDPANPTLPGPTTVTDPATGLPFTGAITYLDIVYFPSAAIVEQFSNIASFANRQLIEGGSGETDLYVNLGSTNAVLATATVAQNEATYYAQMTQKLAIVTYRGGLQSGMGIIVNLPNIKAIGLFIVDTIQLIDENGYWKWTVGCSAGAIVGDWKKAMVALANLL